MQFENFDKRIKDAADHHHPAYDHNAWNKMEKLLNKHMPVEEEKRRGLLFILLGFLLLGGGAFFYFSRNNRAVPKEPIAKTGQTTKTADNHTVTPDNTITNTSPVTKSETGLIQAEENIIKPVSNNRDIFRLNKKVAVNKTRENITDAVPGDKIIADPSVEKKDNLLKNNNEKVDITAKPVTDNREIRKEEKIADKKEDKISDKKEDAVAKAEEQQKKKSKSSKSSFFFLSASAGPDISMTGISSPGRMKWVGGIGAGYTFKEKFTLRAGFYTARKIYTATPEYYHAPSAFYAYYPNLEKIDADCKVYEIPVTLSYNFSRTAKKNLFVSAGLSSYLMKRETYNFYYKYYATGPTVNRKRTVYNDNQHYFSVISLSAGYQRNIGKSFSVTAEPYVKIPFQGVGFGKVPLNSAGVLFTVGYKPFRKSAKK